MKDFAERLNAIETARWMFAEDLRDERRRQLRADLAVFVRVQAPERAKRRIEAEKRELMADPNEDGNQIPLVR